jgi:hypothetical protein
MFLPHKIDMRLEVCIDQLDAMNQTPNLVFQQFDLDFIACGFIFPTAAIAPSAASVSSAPPAASCNTLDTAQCMFS